MPRRLVPISDLAAYAADPEGFKARQGGVASAKSARFGADYHDAFARRPLPRPRWVWYVVLTLSAIVAALLYHSLTV